MCGAQFKTLPEGVQQVAEFLQAKEHPHMPVMLADAARTAHQAAAALGVAVGQIAKSIVFCRKPDDVAVLVVTSGDQRVDEEKLEALMCLGGQRLGRADAEFVKLKTGFSIGGVSPFAHATAVVMVIDQSLFRFDQIWAAAGHPNAVVQLAPTDLEWMTGAPVADLAVQLPGKKTTQSDAIDTVAVHALLIRAGGEILSPCISVCDMRASTNLCQGCFRTVEEIAGWGNASDAAKLAIWARIEARMAAMPK